jgi:hypothetical protein
MTAFFTRYSCLLDIGTSANVARASTSTPP